MVTVHMEKLLKRVSDDKKRAVLEKLGYTAYVVKLDEELPSLDEPNTDPGVLWLEEGEDIEEIKTDLILAYKHTLNEMFKTCIINLLVDKLVFD